MLNQAARGSSGCLNQLRANTMFLKFRQDCHWGKSLTFRDAMMTLDDDRAKKNVTNHLFMVKRHKG
jgi:hypothetical protein